MFRHFFTISLLIAAFYSNFAFLSGVDTAWASEFGLFGQPPVPTVTPAVTPTDVPPSYQSPSYQSPSYQSPDYSSPSYNTPDTGSQSTGADLNGDGKVNIFDLSILLRNWGKSAQGDLNSTGKVEVFDLSILLRSWSK